ncbi:MAG: GMC family oxidoreductase N-terminal domain-containing protein [Alphaproteobacteria bacterium]|nr:GMC family oxidoreductase N-terminal domain-containing protein [Alphaproteobacteria bacterium]
MEPSTAGECTSRVIPLLVETTTALEIPGTSERWTRHLDGLPRHRELDHRRQQQVDRGRHRPQVARGSLPNSTRSQPGLDDSRAWRQRSPRDDNSETSQENRAGATEGIPLSAHACRTPRLLMLSGVGPADALRRHGIPVVTDLPGTGRNLQDHMI